MLMWCALVVAAMSAVLGWSELYEWFVEPAKHHTRPSASFSVHPFRQDG